MKEFINKRIPITVNRFLSKTKSNYFNYTAIVFIKQNNSLYIIDFLDRIFKCVPECDEAIVFSEYKITYSNKVLKFKLKYDGGLIEIRIKDAKITDEWIISNYEDYRVLRNIIEIKTSWISIFTF